MLQTHTHSISLFVIRYSLFSSVEELFDNLGRVILSDHSFVQNGSARIFGLRKQEARMYDVRKGDAGWTMTFPVIKFYSSEGSELIKYHLPLDKNNK